MKSALFRRFRRQLFHASLSAILQPLKAAMSIPEVTRCPDGHFRRVIYGIGPYIADYPEQILAACVVQGWCPLCPQPKEDFAKGREGGRRSREYTEALIGSDFDYKTLWDDWGIVSDIIVRILQ